MNIFNIDLDPHSYTILFDILIRVCVDIFVTGMCISFGVTSLSLIPESDNRVEKCIFGIIAAAMIPIIAICIQSALSALSIIL